jgi:SAM-dependent methyltransferase
MNENGLCPESELVDYFYKHFYKSVFEESSIAAKAYRRTHSLLEDRDFPRSARILEIGAGNGQHLAFINTAYSEYIMLDPRRPSLDLISHEGMVRWVEGSAEDNNLQLGTFDRVIMTCVLHHVTDVAAVLRNISNWLVPGGTFSLFLPSDPGLLNRLNRKLYVNRRARRLGFLEYELVNAREHRNHYWSLKTQLKFHFRGFQIDRRYFPLPIPLASASLFSIWHITKPKADG